MILQKNNVLDTRNTLDMSMSREKCVNGVDGSCSYQTPPSTNSHRLLIHLTSLPIDPADFSHTLLELHNGNLHVSLNAPYHHRLIRHTGERPSRDGGLFRLDCEVGGW